MPTLTLTIRQRLELIQLLNGLARGKKKDPKRLQGRALLKTGIALPYEERIKYVTPTPAGDFRNEAAIRRGPDEDIQLSLDDVRKLNLLMEEGFINLGPEDDDWLDPLQEQLDTIEKEASDPRNKPVPVPEQGVGWSDRDPRTFHDEERHIRTDAVEESFGRGRRNTG